MANGNTFSKYIYYNSPFIVRSIMANIYAVAEFKRKYGGHYFQEYLDFLSDTQWYSRNDIKELQLNRLKKTIKHAYEHVPYYHTLFKNLKLTPDDFRTQEDLVKLPILSREEVQRHSSQLISRDLRSRDILYTYTGGSTCRKLNIAISRKAYQRAQAFIWLHRSWAGIHRGDRTATFAGHLVTDIRQTKPPYWIRNIPENQIIFSSYHMSKRNLREFANALIRFQPELIWGYACSLYQMAQYLLQENIQEIRPKGVFSSSETLVESQKEIIQNAFQANVFNFYANTEMAAIIMECEHGSMHIKPESGIVEFLDHDNQPAAIGREGRMICTGLINDAMPLLRYDMGDVAIPIEKKCACGRPGPFVENIVGRLEDYIITPNGKLVGLLTYFTFADVSDVEEAQIIQEDIHHLIFKIVRGPGYSMKDEENIVREARSRLGVDMKIRFEYVNEIPKLSNGKYRFVISNLKGGAFT